MVAQISWTKGSTMSDSVPSIDTKVAVFATGALAIVALAGVVMGYGVDTATITGGVKLTK